MSATEPLTRSTRPQVTPPRLRRPSFLTLLLAVLVAALLIDGYRSGAKIDPARLVVGLGRLGEFLAEAFPPDLTRWAAVLQALLVTFEMAVLGTLLGVVLSLPLGVLAARNTSPHPLGYGLARGLISLCRTIPDIIWGLLFVITVGLGPEAGVLAITVDVVGFCGRFFAEAIEEVNGETLDALHATGASRAGVLLGAVLPACAPSFVAATLFALESATRSSVVLGVVGAGGIGIELTVAMQLLRYDQALTAILAIFVVVIGVERLSSLLRRRII
nr:phosphonate ABC transporter, permease protein PhnE [Streptomyces sp. NBC_00830]